MGDSDLDQFRLQISADATDKELDCMTRQLLSELREMDIESVQLLRSGPAPMSSKGDPITIGSITREVLPAVIPGVIGLVQAWATRGKGRTVKFKGKGIELEGSPAELQKLLDKLEKNKKKK